MSNKLIQEALIAKMREFSASPAVDVAYPDEKYDPKSDEPYLEVQISLSPTETPHVNFDAPVVFRGFLQVTVVYPRYHGDNNYLPLVDDVIAHFTRGTRMYAGSVRVDIDREPYSSGPLRDGSWSRVPVTIEYKSVV